MLVFKACGECDNIVECPHTPKYNEEISYLMFAQKDLTIADVKVECRYFKPLEGTLEDKIVSVDYKCDDCQKPESEVGSLFHGRLSNGHDYQLCKNCRLKYGETLIKLSISENKEDK